MANREWAIVVGDGLNALGVLRSLALAGVPAALLARSPQAESTHTRARRRLSYYSDFSHLPEALLKLATELGGRPVLFLTEEDAVRVVSEARERLMPALRFRMAPHHMMLALTHKEGVQQACEAWQMPIPAAVRLRSEQDLPQLEGLRFPCVLKPGYKHDGYGSRFKKAYEVDSPAAAQRLFAEISPVLPDLIVQEWITGSDDSIYFCLVYMHESEAVGFTGRKLRAWPPQVGGTASCMPAPEAHEELFGLTTRFFRAQGFEGMGSMEFKRDDRDGRFYVVEPTVGRTDFQQEVATINGCNLPYAAHCMELGMPLPAARATVPMRIWREPTTDRWSAQQQGEHPAFGRYPTVDAYFRWNDLQPWLCLQLDRVRQRLRHRRAQKI